MVVDGDLVNSRQSQTSLKSAEHRNGAAADAQVSIKEQSTLQPGLPRAVPISTDWSGPLNNWVTNLNRDGTGVKGGKFALIHCHNQYYFNKQTETNNASLCFLGAPE